MFHREITVLLRTIIDWSHTVSYNWDWSSFLGYPWVLCGKGNTSFYRMLTRDCDSCTVVIVPLSNLEDRFELLPAR